MWDESLVRWSFGMRPVKDGEERPSTHSAIQKFKKEKERTGPDVTAAPSTHSTPPSVGDRKGRGDRTETSLALNTSISDTIPPTTHNSLANMPSSSPLSSPPSSSSSANTNNFTGDHSGNSIMPSSPEGAEDVADDDASTSDLDQLAPLAMDEMGLPIYPDPDPVSDDILEPVRTELEKLGSLTSPDTYPKGNGFLKVKPHGQLLRERLLPIGEFIRGYAEGNGALELRLCRYIANTYWPLPVDKHTHLDIHALYHNTLYLRARRALLPPSTPLIDTSGESLEEYSPPSSIETCVPPPSRSASPPYEPSDSSEPNDENIPPPPAPSPSFGRRVANAAGNITEKLAGKFNGLVHKGSPSKAKARKEENEEDFGSEAY